MTRIDDLWSEVWRDALAKRSHILSKVLGGGDGELPRLEAGDASEGELADRELPGVKVGIAFEGGISQDDADAFSADSPTLPGALSVRLYERSWLLVIFGLVRVLRFHVHDSVIKAFIDPNSLASLDHPLQESYQVSSHRRS
jgi:hypothetical protein